MSVNFLKNKLKQPLQRLIEFRKGKMDVVNAWGAGNSAELWERNVIAEAKQHFADIEKEKMKIMLSDSQLSVLKNKKLTDDELYLDYMKAYYRDNLLKEYNSIDEIGQFKKVWDSRDRKYRYLNMSHRENLMSEKRKRFKENKQNDSLHTMAVFMIVVSGPLLLIWFVLSLIGEVKYNDTKSYLIAACTFAPIPVFVLVILNILQWWDGSGPPKTKTGIMIPSRNNPGKIKSKQLTEVKKKAKKYSLIYETNYFPPVRILLDPVTFNDV